MLCLNDRSEVDGAMIVSFVFIPVDGPSCKVMLLFL